MNSFEIRNASPSDVCILTRMLETLGYPTDKHNLEARLNHFVRIHIESIFIDSKYRGFEISKKLMQHVEEIAKSYSLAIVCTNKACPDALSFMKSWDLK